MNRQEFEELELQLQQSGLPLKSFLQQLGVSYSTYHYWRKKCSVDKNSVKQELAPISFKQAATEFPLKNKYLMVWHCCFPMVSVPTSGAVQKGY
ncbi:MAG: hypothetical protein V8R28_05555 [Bacteroides cellulosilyticus]